MYRIVCISVMGLSVLSEIFIKLKLVASMEDFCLHCFDTVGWVAGRASGL